MSDFVKIELDQNSVNDVNKSFRDYGKKAAKALKDAILLTGYAIVSDAKNRLNGRLGSAKHWITGRLASSVHVESKGVNSFKMESKDSEVKDGSLGVSIADDEAVVGTNVHYAPKIEFDYDSFLRFAGERQEKKFAQRVTKELNKIK